MPTSAQIAARKAIHDLEADPKHAGHNPAADEQTRTDRLDDPKHQAKDHKQDDRWVELPGGAGWSHPDHDDTQHQGGQ